MWRSTWTSSCSDSETALTNPIGYTQMAEIIIYNWPNIDLQVALQLMHVDTRMRFRAKCRENRASRMLFLLTETSNAENKATVYLIFTDMPARTRTWSSSHFIHGTLPLT